MKYIYIFGYFLLIFVFTLCQENRPIRTLNNDNTSLPAENDAPIIETTAKLPNPVQYMLKERSNERGSVEYPPFDGRSNNLVQPDLGEINTPLLRRCPAAYEDGVNEPSGFKRPSPFKISEQLLSELGGEESQTGKNALLVFFGQHVVGEILNSQRAACPPEYINLKIPNEHPLKKKNDKNTAMPVLRTRYDESTGHSTNNPRQQLNGVTPFLDGGSIYGTSKAWANYLRRNQNGELEKFGQLETSLDKKFPGINRIKLPMENPPPPTRHSDYTSQHETENFSRFFKLGNPGGNENPFLLTFGIIWFRWHNKIALELHDMYADWSNEKLFNEARKWVIATQQNIIVYEWLPQWIGKKLSTYAGYDSSVDPQIDQFFQSAAFRFGHTLVPRGVHLRNRGKDGCDLQAFIRTCNNFWLPENKISSRNKTFQIDDDIIAKLVMGMSVQLAGKDDHKIVEDLEKYVYGPLEFSRRNLMALNIQRGRDHGVPDYNTAREAYNLPKVTSKTLNKDFSKVDIKLTEKFMKLYNNKTNDVDIWVGGIMETTDGPGELFTAIMVDQFERIRNGDRFWFENRKNDLFTEEQIRRIKEVTFYDILNHTMTDIDIPKNVFKVPASKNDIHQNCISQNTLIKGICRKSNEKKKCYYHAPSINLSEIDTCIAAGTYDYFNNSRLSFTFIWVGIIIVIAGFYIFLIAKIHNAADRIKKVEKKIKTSSSFVDSKTMHTAFEWIGYNSSKRPVIICLDEVQLQIQVTNQLGELIRVLDLHKTEKVITFAGHDNEYALIRIQHNYDLVLKFDTIFMRNAFISKFESFLNGKNREIVSRITSKAVLKQAVTIKDRQKKIEQFFRVVFSQAFNIAHSEEELLKIDSTVAKEVIYTELTLLEFAEALSMCPNSEFVKKIFDLVDTDKNGFISFREFIDLLTLFLNGKTDDKVKLMFDMYDINQTGHLKKKDFCDMLRSFMDTVNADISNEEIDSLVDSMMSHAEIAEKESIDLQDFKNILGDYNDKLSYAQLEFNISSDGLNKKLRVGKSTIKSSFIGNVQKTVENMYADPNDLKTRVEGNKKPVVKDSIDGKKLIIQVNHDHCFYSLVMKYFANKQLQIFWIFLYTGVILGIFFERVFNYYVLSEDKGLRQITGLGIPITRGAASAMMFAYSSILITMCRNIITIFRDTILQFYIPFDSALAMHKYIAFWALIFTIIHIIGNAFNFYHILSQTGDDLTCLFRNNYHASHEIPTFHHWAFSTVTGITSILLTLVTGIIFLSSMSSVQTNLHKWFEFGHSIYPVFYILMVAHGSGRFIQEPYFYYFIIGPAIIIGIDSLLSASRKTMEIPLIRAILLPSDVTCLIFTKPPYFQYKSGQWVRISCPELGANSFRPFILSSAPHEPFLTVHIRSLGPWAINLRELLDPTRRGNIQLPKIYVDGPYGESHQNWNKHDISIMIGGGIGVTPFASILKDIVYKLNKNENLGSKKVYFIWVTRSQKQFEWMVDILREVEKADVNNLVSVHIFITQFYQKFDLRTILLYICERHFQKVSNKSLFTGLTGVTHFGRPNFSQFFTAIQQIHLDANIIGVYSSGIPTLTKEVDNACQYLNSRKNTTTLFQHHYKTF